jgi:hypothetical protein
MNKLTRTFAAVALLVSTPMVSACASLGVLGTVGSGLNAISSGLSVTQKACMDIRVQKRFYLAEAGFKGVSIVLRDAAGTVLKGDAAASALAGYERLRAARSLAWTAYDACNASSLAQQVALMEVLVADLQALGAPRPQ